MIDKDEWLKEECRKVKLTKKSISSKQFIILSSFCILLGWVSFLYCKDDFFDKPIAHLDDSRDTWQCSKCGYKNYEGIERCGVCGKRR